MPSNVTVIGCTILVCFHLSSRQANTDYILISVLKIYKSCSTRGASPQKPVLLQWSWCPS